MKNKKLYGHLLTEQEAKQVMGGHVFPWMKKNIIGIHMLMALLFSMCTSPKQQGEGLPVLNVADALDAALPDTFTWNSIAKSVRMIPLKTEQLMGRSLRVQYFSDDLIIVSDRSTGILVFDGEGQEIVSFNHCGPGPKEYLYATNINYNKNDSLILLYDGFQDKLFRFDLKGKFVDVRPANTGGLVLNIDSEGNMFSVNMEGDSFVKVWDSNLQLLGEYLPFDTLYTDKQKVSHQLMSGKETGSATLRVLPVCNDTVYTITKEGAKPFCIVNRGSYKCAPEDLNNMMDVKANRDYLNTEKIYSFSSYFCYITQVQHVTQLWDLRTGELVAWNKDERVGDTFTWISGFRYVFPSGNEFREQVFDYVSQNCGVFIRQADECVDDVPGLTADDNPVLIVLEF